MRAVRALPVALVVALVAPAGAQTVPNPAGHGYGRHALAPPRHDLRPPRHLGPDGTPIPELDTDLREPALGERRYRPQSRASRHANWCRARYRSYDARTDTFVPRAGAARVSCDSPFR